jgi:hypothetical protein
LLRLVFRAAAKNDFYQLLVIETQASQLVRSNRSAAMVRLGAYVEAAAYQAEMCMVSLDIGDYPDRVSCLQSAQGEFRLAHDLPLPEELADSHPISRHASLFIIRIVE